MAWWRDSVILVNPTTRTYAARLRLPSVTASALTRRASPPFGAGGLLHVDRSVSAHISLIWGESGSGC